MHCFLCSPVLGTELPRVQWTAASAPSKLTDNVCIGSHCSLSFTTFQRQQLFRVVGYLPGTGAQAMIAHDLRAGVAQASGEETAENANAGVQDANSMGIRAAVWRPKLAGKRRQCAIALGRGLAQLRWRALRRKCPELWSAARSAGHAPTPPRSPSASTSKTSDGSGVCS